jgi:hypothetical protein
VKSGRAGALAEAHGRRVMSWVLAVRDAKSAALTKFATLILVQALPSELVLWDARRFSNNDQRGKACKLCPCPVDSNEHALCRCTNTAVANARAHAVATACVAFRKADIAPMAGPSEPVPGSNAPPLRMRVWFDPTRRTVVDVCPLVAIGVVRELERYCPLAGLIGILPHGVREILAYAKTPGGWRACSHAEVAARESAIRDALMLSAVRVWAVRYARFVAWWHSDEPAAAAARVARATGRVAHAVRTAATLAVAPPADKKRAPMVSKRKTDQQHAGLEAPSQLLGAPQAPAPAVPPPPPNKCGTCGVADGHNARTCPQKPVRTAGADGRFSSYASRPRAATERDFYHPMVIGETESAKWDAENEALIKGSDWLCAPPRPY